MPVAVADAIVALPDADAPQLIVAAIPFLRDRDLRIGRLGQSADQIQEDLRKGIKSCYEQAATACQQPGWSSAAHLAVGHLTVQGADESDSEREIHIGGLGAVATEVFPEGFSYVALGHLHRPQRVEASARVCYSWSPIALSFSECSDNKSVRVVDFVGTEVVSNEKLRIPVVRQLVQMRCRRADLADTLMQADIPSAELPTWVELFVETTDSAEDLNEFVRELADGKPWEIVRVVARYVGDVVSLTEDTLLTDSIETLLDNPINVFEHLLEQQLELTDDEIAALRTAFAELRDLEIASQDTDAAADNSDQEQNSMAAAGSVSEAPSTTAGDAS